METKSMITGGALVILGAILGFAISLSVSSKPTEVIVKTENCPAIWGEKAACIGGPYGKKTAHKGAKKHKGASLENQLDRLTETLDLTDKQRAEIEAIFVERQNIREERRAEGVTQREARREQNRAERVQMREQISSILNDEQKAAYEQLCEQRKQRYNEKPYKGNRGCTR